MNASKIKNTMNGKPWSDDELKIAVDSYLYMLRLEVSGIDLSTENMAGFLTDGPLFQRNDASLRYRMRNISFVFDKKNLPTIKAYSPAPQVGSGVRKRIEKILDDYPNNLSQLLTGKTPVRNGANLDDVLSKLDQLEKCLGEPADNKEVGIGHNNPPEPMEELSTDIKSARKSFKNIKDELQSQSPDLEKINEEQGVLAKLGLKLATMTETSASIFAKAAIAAAGAGVGAKFLLSNIIETLESLAAYIQTLG